MLMVKIPLFERPVIYDASQFIADLPIQKVIGDSFREATWVSIHNARALVVEKYLMVGLVLDGSKKA
tara:strand:+ start:396 stop:596 length:201 start_codon:yes stop_codon:yes gene_type:complete